MYTGTISQRQTKRRELDGQYNIFDIARNYIQVYFKFLIEDTDIQDSSEAMSLFSYTLAKIWRISLNNFQYSAVIKKYYKKLKSALQLTPDIPSIRNISLSDREKVYQITLKYLEISGVVDEKLNYFRNLKNKES